jgi:23S rRNA (cytidine1920-2'-O)/16S rRNA (cytidine1409-2'-O)-methyltransferase
MRYRMMMEGDTNIRLDKVLVRNGLVSSRARAQILIKEGKVSVNGSIKTESDHNVHENDTVLLLSEDIPWVSRGGLKLEHALAHWGIDARGKVALDIGASTGGFTDVLLSRGAKKVYALDVGHGQLAEKLKNDPRVVSMEGVHIKDVSSSDFLEPLELIVVDVSFISLAHVLPKIKELLTQGGEGILLAKPQFEVGKDFIKKGVVKDSALHLHVITEIMLRAKGLGFVVSEPIPSPILGGDGNKEFLLNLKLLSLHI